MKHKKFVKIVIMLLFAISIFMSWGGMIYATNEPDCFRPIGVVVALLGYGVFFGTVCLYENSDGE